MKRMRRWVGACALIAVCAMGRSVSAEADPWAKVEKSAQATLAENGRGVVIVRLKSSGAGKNFAIEMKTRQANVATRLAAEPGWRLRHQFSSIPYLVAEVDHRALGALAAMEDVESIETDRRVGLADVDSNARIGATQVRQTYGYTGLGVNVGIIDTGVDLNHPDLAGSVIAGRRILDQQATQNNNVQDDVGHGSHVAGVITSDGKVAPAGVAPGARLVVVKAVDADGGWVSDVAAGIDWIVQQNQTLASKVRFINLSVYFLCADNDPSCVGELPAQCPCDNVQGFDLFKAAVAAAKSAGITCIAAAGNDGAGVLRVPACLSNVVSVGATFDNTFPYAPPGVGTNASATFESEAGSFFAACRHSSTVQADWLVCFSNRHPVMDFVAPGYSISSVNLGDNVNARSSYGTSQATAHVTGGLALLQQARPWTSTSHMLQILHATATKVPENPAQPSGQRYDRINLLAAMQLVLQSGAEDSWVLFE